MTERPQPEPLDPFEAAVAFAIRRAAERRRREAAERDQARSTMRTDPIQGDRSRRDAA